MTYIKILTLSLLLLTLNSCGENTTTPITTDVSDMTIDTPATIYSTDAYLPTATVLYADGNTDNATDNINWAVSDTQMLYLSNDLIILPLKNDGNSTLTAGYNNFEFFENNVTLDIVGITDLNSSWRISSPNITTTGTFNLSADGNYTDGIAINKPIERNIAWTSSSPTATFTTDENYNVQINIVDTGNINITATLFGDENASMTKSYTIAN